MLAPMPGAVRRPAGAARAVAASLVVLVASGCGGIGQPAPYDSPGINGLVIPTPTPDPADFGASIDNPWLPLAPGSTWRFDVTDGGATVGSIEAEVLEDSVDVAGLDATAVRTTTSIDEQVETSTRFYAQDDHGNVWWLGEDAGDVTWRAGEAGAEAGLAMPAAPRLGDGWLSYVVAGLPEASVRVEEQGRDMVQTRDESDTSTRRTYTSGVGLVGVEDLDSGLRVDLVDHLAG
jgi:hypothetical protein